MTGRAAKHDRGARLMAGAISAAFWLVSCSQPASTGTSNQATRAAQTAAGTPAASVAATAGGPTATTRLSTAAPSARASQSAIPASAWPGSLVFIRAFNVWLAAPDGTGARQLTRDGTASAGYHDPSQAPDGRIFVLRGRRSLLQLDRSGNRVGSVVSLNTLENGAEALAVSPDGSRLAYVTTGYGQSVDPRFGTPSGTFLYGGTDIATPDGLSVAGSAAANMLFPHWLGSTRYVASDGVALFSVSVPGQAETFLKIEHGCLIELDCPAGQEAQAAVTGPTVSRDGRLLAYSYRPYFGVAGRRFASLDAAPPAASGAPRTRCVIPGQEHFSDPGSIAPDGGAFAYDDTNFDPSTFETRVGLGILVMNVDGANPECGASSATLVLPGGAQPDWGPAVP